MDQFWNMDQGRKSFRHGKDTPRLAADAAKRCGAFCPDDEEEWEADEDVSCYNCRFRRWTADSFDCMRKR
jgi:hypothetical protein